MLSGRLDRASTHTLEAAIEHLCESGVTALVIDLRNLSGIDRAGVAVIAFRRKWCARRGCALTLVHGAPAIRQAFELAGVVDALAFEEADGAAQATRRS